MSDTLCRACGLCCDGTFFGSVVIEHAEADRLERIRLPLFQDGEELGMEQPCSALHDDQCAVYADRPSACAEYECELRKRVDAGARTLEQAQAHVITFRALLMTLRDVFDCPAPASFWNKILLLEEEGRVHGSGALSAEDYDLAVTSVSHLLELGRTEFDAQFAF